MYFSWMKFTLVLSYFIPPTNSANLFMAILWTVNTVEKVNMQQKNIQ
ncbi:MAG: hypothetical protein Hyperionvirus15_48 [Hyperionvirus sp.]|uniref:Uncharacterized protein n=1 Tax=Hyperionvirus sp. TaxID=2487770 RepID=A0A3G5A9T8_9VIRU|nr:MAG: hypothetical protein Hyperionvirus15_48 [Hyperionvirus sp.]